MLAPWAMYARRVSSRSAGAGDGGVDQRLQRGRLAGQQQPPAAGEQLVRRGVDLQRDRREAHRGGEVVPGGREAGVQPPGERRARRGGPGPARRDTLRRARRRASRGAPARSSPARGRWAGAAARALAPSLRSAPSRRARVSASACGSPRSMSSNSAAVARRWVTCASRSVTAVRAASAASSRTSSRVRRGPSSSATCPSDLVAGADRDLGHRARHALLRGRDDVDVPDDDPDDAAAAPRRRAARPARRRRRRARRRSSRGGSGAGGLRPRGRRAQTSGPPAHQAGTASRRSTGVALVNRSSTGQCASTASASSR